MTVYADATLNPRQAILNCYEHLLTEYLRFGRRNCSPNVQETEAPEEGEILQLKFSPRTRSGAGRSVLNCTVVGADGVTPYYHIMSGDAQSGSGATGGVLTVLRTNAGRTVASVEWPAGVGAAYVQARDVLQRVRVRDFLSISADGSYRSMSVFGQQFVWVPQPTAICMYQYAAPTHPHSQPTPRLIARVEKVTDQHQDPIRYELSLEVASHAANTNGMLTMIVLATMMFHSGCNLDS